MSVINLDQQDEVLELASIAMLSTSCCTILINHWTRLAFKTCGMSLPLPKAFFSSPHLISFSVHISILQPASYKASCVDLPHSTYYKTIQSEPMWLLVRSQRSLSTR